MEIHEAIKTRRSIGRMTDEVPPREAIEKLIDAAIEAPNHYDTQPWRFFVLSGKAREEFGDVLAETLKLRWRDEDTSKLANLMTAERNKPMRSPVLVIVGVKHSQDERIVPREDLQAASAAIQNMLLTAHANGLSAVWRTGDGAYDDKVKAYFDLDPGDEIAGVVYVGYPDPESASRITPRTRSHDGMIEWRDG
jgi:nitroreductase